MAGLASRLSKLRAQAGRPSAADSGHKLAVNGGSASIVSELKRRSVARTSAARVSSRGGLEALAEQVGGEEVAPGLLVVEKSFSIERTQGNVKIGAGVASGLDYFGYSNTTPVFLDTETTGLSGGAGTLVFLVGVARLRDDRVELLQGLLTRYEGEAAMLERVSEFATPTDLLVTYNGKSFDLPLLGSRYRLTGVVDPFPTLDHFDLLHTTQRAFRKMWPQCTLQEAERRLLKFKRIDDLPGSLAPQTWFDWLRSGRPGRLPSVLIHNELDVLSMAALVSALQVAYATPTVNEIDFRGVARFLSRRHGVQAAYELLHANRADLDVEAALELAVLARRRSDWPVAVDSWQRLARHGHAEALEGLAKYYEHVDRDFAQALQLTDDLLRVDGGVERHHRRRQRLLVKHARRACSRD